MSYLKPIGILAILLSALLCSEARATERPPRPGGTAPPQAQAQAQAQGPDQPAPKKPPVKRRAVRQIVDGMPAPSATPRPPTPLYIAPPGLQPSAILAPSPPGPSALQGCLGSTCTDTSGARYNGGIGTTLISPSGQLCSNHGATVQCF